MDEDAAYFRLKAQECRRIAYCLPSKSDPAAVALMEMAVEFTAMADSIDSGQFRLPD
jgi:hypothetical protein